MKLFMVAREITGVEYVIVEAENETEARKKAYDDEIEDCLDVETEVDYSAYEKWEAREMEEDE